MTDGLDSVVIPPQLHTRLRSVVGEGATLLTSAGGIISLSAGKQLTVPRSD